MSIKPFEFEILFSEGEVFYKGSVTKKDEVDQTKNFRDLLLKLKNHSKEKLNELSNDIVEIHLTLIRSMNVLSCSGLSQFHNLIRETFSGLETKIPGTLGAFYAGCLNHVDDAESEIPRECMIDCAGGIIPPPKGDKRWNSCKNNVYWIEYNKNLERFDILALNDDENERKDALIFYDDQSNTGLPNFTQDNIELFKKKNVEMIKIIGYDKITGKTSIKTDFIPLESLMSQKIVPDERPNERNVKREKPHFSSQQNYNDSGKGWVFFLIVVILLVIFFIIRNMQR